MSLGNLLHQAAEKLPGVAFSRSADDLLIGPNFSAAELERRAECHAKLWLASGPGQGDRVGVVAVPEPEIVAALVGAVRAGLEVVLFSPSLGAPEIAATSGLARALALAGPSEFAGLDYAKRLSEARAAAAMNWLMLWEADRPRLFRLDNGQPTESALAPAQGEAGLTVLRGSRIVALDGPGLNAVAGDMIEALALQLGETLISLVSPATPAGLAAGIHVPLLSGAKLIWQAPFSAKRLDEALTASGRAHLVAPGSIVAALGPAGLLSRDRLASLTLIVSQGDPTPFFDTDLDPDQVFLLDSCLSGPLPLSRFSGDPMTYAEDEDLG
jgi:acyl-coenzyme A synthetase/AMP-(fatty) acid ligase